LSLFGRIALLLRGAWSSSRAMDHEQFLVLIFFVGHVTLTPFVLNENLKIALPTLALMLAFGAYLLTFMGMHMQVYTHVVPGIALLSVGQSVVNGNGGPVETGSIVGPLLIFVEEGFIAQYLAYKVYTDSFYSLSHNLLHFTVAWWMASLLLDHVYKWRYPHLLAPLRKARAIYDPAIMVCLGLLMVGHQHDTTYIGDFFHDIWGAAWIYMGVMHLLSSMVHAVLPREAPLSALLRGLHAFGWLFNGLWACLMGWWVSLWSDEGRYARQPGSGRWTGAREVIWPVLKQKLPSGFEEGLALFGVTIWLSGALLAVQLYRDEVRERARAAPAKSDETIALVTA